MAEGACTPDEVMPFPLSRTESWDYFYMDTWGFYSAYSVTFGADGRVFSKMARRLNDGGDHGSPSPISGSRTTKTTTARWNQVYARRGTSRF